ncbi:MAG: YabP/YqfC family sporulation protein [Lachnospiraceae bacterium]|nr:YabP/YqfC family sporulation protein [Lachnospiraceae bacterium]MDY3224028.1 YabP/YqfC family sporulation protein [Lachnospiraceae bacterium]MDY4096162.1 YabP/YqfC family sporulation protein [Lachnospiraceae bacterium]
MADHKAQEKIVDCLELPKDILLGASIITALGNRELVIENYKGILDYQEECILLQGKHYRIQIKGKRLRIAYYTKEEMKICGCITEVAYQ